MASFNVPDSDNSFDDLFEQFIETLVSTHTAVSIDNESQCKIQFKLYLEIAVVLITILAKGLRYKEEHPDFTIGSTDDICHKILSNLMKKIEFVKSLNTNDDPILFPFYISLQTTKWKQSGINYSHTNTWPISSIINSMIVK